MVRRRCCCLVNISRHKSLCQRDAVTDTIQQFYIACLFSSRSAFMSRIVVIGAGLAGLSTVTRLLELSQSQPARERPTIQLWKRVASWVVAPERFTIHRPVSNSICVNTWRWAVVLALHVGSKRGKWNRTSCVIVCCIFWVRGNELCSFQGSRWLPAPLHLTSCAVGFALSDLA